MNHLSAYIEQIRALCKRYHVIKLYVFGSVLTTAFNKEQSDIDLIVDFEAMPVEAYADNYFDFKFSLQDLLNRNIDLLEEKSLKNPYFLQSIGSKRQLIYG